MSGPKRIQRMRTKGWRMPEGVVYVGRPSKWGNCFSIRGNDPSVGIVDTHGLLLWTFTTRASAVVHAVQVFRWQLENHPNVTGFSVEDVRRDLVGRDLACWCPLDSSCHGDVLLQVANGDTP